MDSLTQITLGAAMGEVVLGRKIGNRAMLWGAIGGTIPDLDIISNFFLDEMSSLAFHRGISHSFFFAVTAPFLFGWLVWRLYRSGFYLRTGYRLFVSILNLALLSSIAFGINYLPTTGGGSINYGLLACSIVVLAGLAFLLWKYYYRSDLIPVEATYRDWYWLFFWSVFTHPILDAFTPFGTQLFQPFSDYRVAFNNISVVDPIYTVPFLLCVIIAAFLHRTSKTRRFFNWLGIGLSSAYMLLTLVNKYRIDRIFEQSLSAQGITYQRFTTSPTIFNNILWQGVAETDTAFIYGMYSFYDAQPLVGKFVSMPKNHQLVEQYQGDRDMHILRWFTKDYFNIIRRKDGQLQLNDLRYGSVNGSFEDEKSYVFRFILEEKDGTMTARQTREGNDLSKEAFAKFGNRIMGKEE